MGVSWAAVIVLYLGSQLFSGNLQVMHIIRDPLNRKTTVKVSNTVVKGGLSAMFVC